MRYKNNSISNKNGFTLIELLIVMAIIVIVYGTVMLNMDIFEYLRQARDSRRINDLLQLQNSISMATLNNDIKLINTLGCTSCTSLNEGSADGKGWIKFENLTTKGLSSYIATLPTDPINNGIHIYRYYSDGLSYEINTILESDKYSNYMSKDGGNDNGMYERGLNLSLK